MTSIKDRCIFGSFMILFLLSYGLLAQDLSLSDLTRVRSGRSAAVTSSEPDFRSNLDRATYIKPGETLVMADIIGPAVVQHIWLTFNEARPVLELEFDIEKEDYRGLVLRFTKAGDYGIFRILLDGKNVAELEKKDWLRSVDFYSERLTATDLYVGSLRLPKGKHVLRLEGVGRNPLSKGGAPWARFGPPPRALEQKAPSSPQITVLTLMRRFLTAGSPNFPQQILYKIFTSS